jgi:hypothetical protein
MEGKAGLRIAYSNQKQCFLKEVFFKCVPEFEPKFCFSSHSKKLSKNSEFY